MCATDLRLIVARKDELFKKNLSKNIHKDDWLKKSFAKKKKKYKCFLEAERNLFTCMWQHQQTFLPIMEALVTGQPKDFRDKQNTLGSLSMHRTQLALQKRPHPTHGCREKPVVVSKRGESQLSNKASSICIHRHGYCLQWASPCWQGERWREGKMTTQEQSHHEK